ncbi:MAG: DUF2442 domain-containing protein [Spirochaetaceae bacterium]|jgi:hypothetical protein|nr:DUF2442 domain-containing protein [Spirochaetaceae bacterium]
MFHKVKAVTPLSEYRLLVSFSGGEQKQYDVKPLCGEWNAFKPLLYIAGLFEQVRIDGSGYGVSWNADIDLSCEELYENGVALNAGD